MLRSRSAPEDRMTTDTIPIIEPQLTWRRNLLCRVSS